MRYKIELCKAIYSDYISLSTVTVRLRYNFYEDCKIFPAQHRQKPVSKNPWTKLVSSVSLECLKWWDEGENQSF